jgi:signal transduction histidine kinase
MENSYFAGLQRKYRLFFSRPVFFFIWLPLFYQGVFHVFSIFRGRPFGQSALLMAQWSGIIVILTLVLLLIIENLFKKLRDSVASTPVFITKYISCGILGVLGARYFISLFFKSEMLNKEFPFAIYQVILFSILFGGFRFILKQTQDSFLLEQNYKDAQYAALKSKLSPHFLFNTLNLISSEIEYNPKNAIALLEELSELLHNIISISKRKLVPLKQELDLLKHYLNLQQQRFEDRFEYKISVDEESLSVAIPPLILQPFVENFFVHAFSKIEHRGQIIIKAENQPNHVILSVFDNGSGFNSENITPGLGTTTVQDALKLLYGNSYKYEIKSAKGVGTTVTIHIPKN